MQLWLHQLRRRPPCKRSACVTTVAVVSLLLLVTYVPSERTAGAKAGVTAVLRTALRYPGPTLADKGSFDLMDPCTWPSWAQPLPMQVCAGWCA